MMSEGAGSVALQTVRLGDRGRTAKDWLVVSSGALRSILSEGPEGSIFFGFACDRRIMPEGEPMMFLDLDDAVLHLVRHPTVKQLEARLRELETSTLKIEWMPRCYGDADLCLKRVLRAITDA